MSLEFPELAVTPITIGSLLVIASPLSQKNRWFAVWFQLLCTDSIENTYLSLVLKMGLGIFKNRVTEKDIRLWFDQNGFFGRSAEIRDLELHAIKRPGWRQVFRFTANAKPKSGSADGRDDSNEESNRVVKHGIVVDDQRKRTEAQQTQIYVFESIDERDELLDELSSDMLTCSPGQNGDLLVLTGVVVTFVVLAVVLGSLIGN